MTIASESNVTGLLLVALSCQLLVAVFMLASFVIDFAIYNATISFGTDTTYSFTANTAASMFTTKSTVSVDGCTSETTVDTNTFAEEQGWGDGIRSLQALTMMSFFIMIAAAVCTFSITRETDIMRFHSKLRLTSILALLGWIFLWCVIDPYNYAENMYGFCLSQSSFNTCSSNPQVTAFNTWINTYYPNENYCFDTAPYGTVTYKNTSALIWLAWACYVCLILVKVQIRRTVLSYYANGNNRKNVVVINTNSNSNVIAYGNNQSQMSQPVYVQEQQQQQQQQQQPYYAQETQQQQPYYAQGTQQQQPHYNQPFNNQTQGQQQGYQNF